MSANAPAAVSIKKDIPAKDLKEFVAWAKQNGDKVKQAHGGVGGTSHMACLLFNQVVGIKPTLVAYRGMGPGMNDLMGGHIDIALRAGRRMAAADQGRARSRAIVVAGPQRLAGHSECPDRQGSRRAELPAQHLERHLSRRRARRRRSSPSSPPRSTRRSTIRATAEKLGKLGGTVPPKAERGPEYLRKTVASDIPRWAPILKEAAATTSK